MHRRSDSSISTPIYSPPSYSVKHWSPFAEVQEDRFSLIEPSEAPSETSTDPSTTVYTADSPRSSFTPTIEGSWNDVDGYYSVPWPGQTFMILEAETRRTIALTEKGIRLKNAIDVESSDCHFLCVERDGYFGFLNPARGRYIGHDGEGKEGMRGTAKKLSWWEYWVVRKHPDGGYCLLVPEGRSLKLVVVAEDGETLARRDHGITRWNFARLSGQQTQQFAGYRHST
ncbi:unnamed protein product [Clonostachys solani]|uniref:Uncharacterized protein n=1 Tax=Clonostachys solani TaxID=160281 RepID=A0A9P0EQA8_9HYPO|nr:unnamed protein product [Clonostachys solani]